jgi:hypothetical protein
MASEADGIEAAKAAGIQADKAARNHSLLREANERIFVMADSWGGSTRFYCECGNNTCTQTIQPSLAEYEHIRSSPTSFVIAIGHDLAEFENVMQVCDRYEVVQQKGAGRIGPFNAR